MSMEFSTITRYGGYVSAFFLSIEALVWLYVRQRDRIATVTQINEVVFTQSNAFSCCPHGADAMTISKCKFEHCKGRLSRKIINHIDSAKHLICVAMYMFTMRHIGDANLNAKKRGVVIRIISDQSMIAASGTQINRLQAAGIAVRIAGNGEKYMHNKYCMVDVLTDEQRITQNEHHTNGILINGSLNWTTNAFDRNFENIHFTSNECVKDQYKREFDQLWKRLQ